MSLYQNVAPDSRSNNPPDIFGMSNQQLPQNPADSDVDDYDNTEPRRRQNRLITYTNPLLHTNNNQILTEKINYIRDLVKLKSHIDKVKKSYLYLSLFLFLLILISFIVGYFIISNSYHSLIQRINEEDMQIFHHLKELYKKCKENPMDFDWTAAIYDKMDEIAKKIPKDTAELMSQLFKEFLDYIISNTENFDHELQGEDVKFKFSLDRGENIEIIVGKVLGKDKKTNSKKPDDGSRNPFVPRIIPTGRPDPRITHRTTRSPWIGPPGNPGEMTPYPIING